MPYLRDALAPTPQSEPLDERQVANSAGGYSYALDPLGRLRRFLILGSEGGSYYAGERKLTKENLANVRKVLAAQPADALALIRDVSVRGLAPRNDEAIIALALACEHTDADVRAKAYTLVPDVCRTGTHLFQFADFTRKLGHSGHGLRRALARWYTEKKPDQLAYQLVKYRQRGGWTHRDVLRIAHPKAPTAEHSALFQWVTHGETPPGEPFDAPVLDVLRKDPFGIINAFNFVQQDDVSVDELALIVRAAGLPREALPTGMLTKPEVWEALLENMPMTAMIRNLANMTRAGLLAPNADGTRKVLAELGNADRIRKARVHPIAVLFALTTYAAGHGFRGQNTWNPVAQIVDALDAAFYTAFENVEPTGKRYLLALDVSGSMGAPILNSMLSARAASSAMALVTAKTEQNYEAVAFQTQIEAIPLSRRQRLDDVMRIPWRGGGTDCSQPMLYAMAHKRQVDVFVVYTDSETWAGAMHPVEALRRYRNASGIDAKLIVVGMVSNGFTIADPQDAGMLDVVGFDASAPQVIADFSRGLI